MSTETEERQQEAAPAPAEAQAQAQGRFVGGVVHIECDAETGGMKISAPDNMVVALGILETAKAILIENHAAKQRAPQPAILRAGVDALHRLERPS